MESEEGKFSTKKKKISNNYCAEACEGREVSEKAVRNIFAKK